MNLTFINPGKEYMISSVMLFQTDEETAFWSEPLFHFYPQLDREKAGALSFQDKKKYIAESMGQIYDEQSETLDKKIVLYGEYWKKCRCQIEAALSDAFGTDCSILFNDLVCNISLNPISPRFLREKYFEVFYLNSEKGAIGLSVHEIIHFVWFYVWNQIFHDSYETYERPSVKWILSEMVVESIMKDQRLSSVNPYFPREAGGCIYPYFFDMNVEGKPVLDTLDLMYRKLDIKSFMRESYQYCLNHEEEIRRHIDASESGM